VWGNNDDDNIVWGNLDDDNIVWGNLTVNNVVGGYSALLGSVVNTTKSRGQAKKGVK
jgi:hypothetical protein